jgi:hypothetical protein
MQELLMLLQLQEIETVSLEVIRDNHAGWDKAVTRLAPQPEALRSGSRRAHSAA